MASDIAIFVLAESLCDENDQQQFHGKGSAPQNGPANQIDSIAPAALYLKMLATFWVNVDW